ncbi:MAG: O-antigen ligase family protein [Oscillospiraceae bacterium]
MILKIRKSLKISTVDLLALFIIFQFIPVYAITQIITVKVYNLISLCVSFGIILYCFLKKQKWSSTSAIWLLYTVVLISSCLLNRISPFFAVLYGVRVLAFIIINEYFIKCGKLELLKVSRSFMTVLIFLTTAQQFIDQSFYGMTGGGNYETFFISDNYLGYFYTAYISLCVMLDILDHNKITAWTYFVSIICLMSIIRSWAVKSIIGLVILLIYMIFIFGKRISEFFSQKKLTVVYIVVYVFVVFVGLKGDLISGILEKFGRDTSLSGRYYIWESTINNIKRSPIYGYGVDSTGLMPINEFYKGVLISSHNMFMEVVIQTGFVGLIIYLMFLSSSLVKGSKIITKNSKNVHYSYLFLVFTVFIIFIMGIASPTLYQPFYYMPLLLLVNLNELENIRRRKDDCGEAQ